MKIKTVSIIGLGALGILYASHIAKAIPKENLRIVANKNRIDRYKGKGVYCNNELCDFNYVTPDEKTEPSDLVIFAVKYNGLLQAISDIKNQIGKNTIILSVLNGISSEEVIGKAFGMDKVLYCVAEGMDAVKEGNHLKYDHIGKLCFGEKDNTVWSSKVKAVAEFFNEVKLPYEVPVDMDRKLWSKFMLNTGANQVTAAFDIPYGKVQEEGEPRDLMIKAMKEVIEISKCEGINLNGEDIDYWLKVISNLSPYGKTSMLQDVEAKRPTEVDLFSGTIIKLGKKHNIKTPINDYLYNKIKELESSYISSLKALH